MFKFRGKYDVSWAPLTEWSYWKCLYVFAKWLIFQGDTFWWEICPCRWTLVQDVVMTDLRDYCVSIHLDCARKALEEKPTSHIVRVMRWDKHKPQAATERTSRPVRRQKKATQCKQTACLVSDTKRECVCVCVLLKSCATEEFNCAVPRMPPPIRSFTQARFRVTAREQKTNAGQTNQPWSEATEPIVS